MLGCQRHSGNNIGLQRCSARHIPHVCYLSCDVMSMSQHFTDAAIHFLIVWITAWWRTKTQRVRNCGLTEWNVPALQLGVLLACNYSVYFRAWLTHVPHHRGLTLTRKLWDFDAPFFCHTNTNLRRISPAFYK